MGFYTKYYQLIASSNDNISNYLSYIFSYKIIIGNLKQT